MDNLKFVSSWRGGIQGSKLPIKLGGIQLEGCSFDGTRLSENQHDSPSVSAIPPCVVAWVTKVTHLSLFLFFFFNSSFWDAMKFPEFCYLQSKGVSSSTNSFLCQFLSDFSVLFTTSRLSLAEAATSTIFVVTKVLL